MTELVLQRAVPNEKWQVILEFNGPQYRLFDTSILRKEKGWHKLAYPQHVKRFAVDSDAICWAEGGKVDAEYLYQRSTPMVRENLEQEALRLSYKNQAPTSEHERHHVYYIYLAPFSKNPFRIGENIGGGIAERDVGQDFSIKELLLWPQWKRQFELSGCSWAISKLESHASEPERLIDSLVSEACARNGMPEA